MRRLIAIFGFALTAMGAAAQTTPQYLPANGCSTKAGGNLSCPGQVSTGGIVMPGGTTTNCPNGAGGLTACGAPVTGAPTFSPVTGFIGGSASVTITSSVPGSTLLYCLSSTPGCPPTTIYTTPVSVTAAGMNYINAVSLSPNMVESALASWQGDITAVLPPPTFTPNGGGTFNTAQSVAIVFQASIGGVSLYYTTNGTTPTCSSLLYTAPIPIATTTTVKALACGPGTGFGNSSVASATYTINTSAPTVATPAISPATGSYALPQTITITDGTAGASIYWDYAIPNGHSGTHVPLTCLNGTLYTAPFALTSPFPVEAIGCLSGDADSAVAENFYTLYFPPPAFLPPGPYTGPGTTLTLSTPGMTGTTIVYGTGSTAAGCTPTTTYTTGLSFSANEFVCAYAYYSAGYGPSSGIATWQGTLGSGGGSGGYAICPGTSGSGAVYACTSTPSVASIVGATILFQPDVTSLTNPVINVNAGGNLPLAASYATPTYIPVEAGQLVAGNSYLLTLSYVNPPGTAEAWILTSPTTSGGGGTTTNPLTMAASGGAGPGATFNGSAAVTQDYHTIGAGGIAAANTWSAFNTFGVGIDVSGNAELDGYVVYPCSGSSGNPTLDGTSINLLMYAGLTAVKATGNCYLGSASFALTAAANASAGTTVYTGTITGGASNALVNQYTTISGFTNGANNSASSWVITASTATTITVSNPSGVAEAHAGTAIVSGAIIAPNLSHVDLSTASVTVAADNTTPTYATGALTDVAARNPTTVSLSCTAIAPATLALTSVANASAGTTVYTGTITGGGSSAFAGQIVNISGFATSANNGNFTITASTATTITVNNAGGVAETHAATVGIGGNLLTGCSPATFTTATDFEQSMDCTAGLGTGTDLRTLITNVVSTSSVYLNDAFSSGFSSGTVACTETYRSHDIRYDLGYVSHPAHSNTETMVIAHCNRCYVKGGYENDQSGDWVNVSLDSDDSQFNDVYVNGAKDGVHFLGPQINPRATGTFYTADDAVAFDVGENCCSGLLIFGSSGSITNAYAELSGGGGSRGVTIEPNAINPSGTNCIIPEIYGVTTYVHATGLYTGSTVGQAGYGGFVYPVEVGAGTLNGCTVAPSNTVADNMNFYFDGPTPYGVGVQIEAYQITGTKLGRITVWNPPNVNNDPLTTLPSPPGAVSVYAYATGSETIDSLQILGANGYDGTYPVFNSSAAAGGSTTITNFYSSDPKPADHTTTGVTITNNWSMYAAAPASGGPNCMQISTTGKITNTGSACGSGGSGDTITSPNSTLVVGGTSANTTLDLAGAAGKIMAGSTPTLTYTPQLGVDNSQAGTWQLANGSANAHTILGSAATTSNTFLFPATAPTNLHCFYAAVSGTTTTLTDCGYAYNAIPGADISGAVALATTAANLSISGQTGLLSFTGLTSTNRIKTVRDAADTILELGGSYTPTGTWTWTSCSSCVWPTFNQNTSGTASNLSGTPALPNGTTATTQTAASNDTKLATDAYVDGHFIASGTSAMGTGGISSGTCATTVTTAASGVATTDVIVYTSNVNPQGVTGYAASATGSLYIWAYPTSGNVNFEVCNNTASTITPSALTLNWKVTR